MNTYSVALMNFFDNVNKVVIVEAKSPSESLLIAATDILKGDQESLSKDMQRWISEMEGKTIEEIQQAFFDTDMVISAPVEIL